MSDRTDAREAKGSGLLSRPASNGRAGSNPAPSVGFDDCARDETGVAPGGAKQASNGARESLPTVKPGGSGRNATWSYRLRLAWERRKLATSETWLRLWGIDGEILPPSHQDAPDSRGSNNRIPARWAGKSSSR